LDGIALDGLNLEIYYQQLEPCKVGINNVSGSNDTVLVKQNHGESCQHQEIHRGLLVAIVPGYHIEATYLTGLWNLIGGSITSLWFPPEDWSQL